MKFLTVLPRRAKSVLEILESMLTDTQTGMEGEELVFTIRCVQDVPLVEEFVTNFGYIQSRQPIHYGKVSIYYFVEKKK